MPPSKEKRESVILAQIAPQFCDDCTSAFQNLCPLPLSVIQESSLGRVNEMLASQTEF